MDFFFPKGTPLIAGGHRSKFYYAFNERIPDYRLRTDCLVPSSSNLSPTGNYFLTDVNRVYTFTDTSLKLVGDCLKDISLKYNLNYPVNFQNSYSYLPSDDEFLERTGFSLVPYVFSVKTIPFFLIKDSLSNYNSGDGYEVILVYRPYIMQSRLGYYHLINGPRDDLLKLHGNRISIVHKERCTKFNAVLKKISGIREELLTDLEHLEVRLGRTYKENDDRYEKLSETTSILFSPQEIVEIREGVFK